MIGADTDTYVSRNCELTNLGREYYAALLKDLPETAEPLLRDFKRSPAVMPLRQPVRYVYRRSPQVH